MGCHTIFGEGAYYAPELTRVVERRGKDWIRLFLHDPAKVFPNQRQMVNYGFDKDQIEDVIAFLEWIQNVDTNGFPAKPDLAPAQVKTAGAAGGKLASAPPKFKVVCMSCHSLDGQGASVGPALDNLSGRESVTGKEFTPEYLDKWLSDPQAEKSGTAMPNPKDLGVSLEERKEIASFLLSHGGPQGGVR
ncbi:MAG: cytochrome c [Polyangiaceae bacterium]|nr:cytochrome c [Polyangiaceae bacterium]